jgi:phage shock protein A
MTPRSPDNDVREELAAELARIADALPSHVDVDPDLAGRDLAKLVLTLIELIRQVVEHQAVRRMEDPDLSPEQVERMGLALMRLEQKMAEMRDLFGLAAEDLNIDLGPLGRIL